MNKKIIGLSIATLFAATGAYAQSTNGSSVELYGVLDLAVGSVQYSLGTDPSFPATVNPVSATKFGTPAAPAVTQSVTGMFNGGITPSRWGIRGTEDLGGGVKAIFNLDSYFNAQSGQLSNAGASLANNKSGTFNTVSAASSLNGQLFNDVAYVGLSDSQMGTLTFGRQWAPMGDILKTYDAVQDAQLFSPLGFSGAYAGGGQTESKRQDSSIKYINKFGDFNVTAMIKLGGVAGKSSAEGLYGLGAGYEADGFGVQAAYQSGKDVIHGGNSAIAGDVNVSNYDTEAYMIAAKYAFGDAKITGGYQEFTLKKPTDSVNSLGVSNYYGYQIGNLAAVATTALCATGDSGNFCGQDQKTDIFWVGGDYNFTPAFNLAVGFYDINPKASSDYIGLATTGAINSYTPTGGVKITPQASGNIYEYSLLADYRFSKRTDVYAGMMYTEYKGDNYSSLLYNSKNSIYAVGVRHRF